MHQDTTKTVSKSSFAFLVGTFLSRGSGMFRDMAMAFCFGSSGALAAFMVAYRFANLLRRLFGETSASSGFVPHFEHLRKSSPQLGARFFRDMFFSLSFFLLFFLLLLEGGLLCWYQWGAISPASKEVLYLTILMLPGVLFICLYGITMALLQCEKSYFLPGVAPIAFNVVWIAAVFYLKDQGPSQAAIGLSLAVILAFFFQWLLLVPKMFEYMRKSLAWSQVFSFQLFSPEIKKIFKPFLLSILGIAAVQVNSALDAVFARFASEEGPAYLWYAIRIQQLPIALFGVALSAALLPPLARAVAEKNWDKYREFVVFSLSRAFNLIVPCSMALFVLGVSGVNFLFGRGDFGFVSTLNTVLCLWGYSLGLLPYIIVLILAPAFYAQKNFRLPTIASAFSVLLNVILNYVFVFIFHWGALSVALATSVAALFNCLVLITLLSKQIGPLFPKAFLQSFAKTVLCTFVAGGLTLVVGHFLVKDPTVSIVLGLPFSGFSRHFLDQLLQLFVLSGFFLLTFLSYAWMLNVEDVLALIGLKKKKSALETD